MSNFYVVATPIGNLGDISQRALDILKKVDLVLAEDTRVSKNLLTHFSIEKQIISFHQHSKIQKIEYILEQLRQGKDVALITDAGTPGISDPGNKLVEEVIKDMEDKVNVIPIPGPSAITCLASVAGFSMDKFLFLGFPPVKKGRNKFFEEVLSYKYPVVLYESPYRILKTISEIKEIAKRDNKEARLVVGRELTKKFETIYRGSIEEVENKIKSDKLKGEFVLIIKTS